MGTSRCTCITARFGGARTCACAVLLIFFAALLVWWSVQRLLDFIEAHREDFEPFVEDDEPFDRVRQSATHAARLR